MIRNHFLSDARIRLLWYLFIYVYRLKRIYFITCHQLLEKLLREANWLQKIWKTHTDKENDIVTIKRYGTYSSSQTKTREKIIKGDKFNQEKACVMKRDLLSIVIKEAADFHQIQTKAADHI